MHSMHIYSLIFLGMNIHDKGSLQSKMCTLQVEGACQSRQTYCVSQMCTAGNRQNTYTKAPLRNWLESMHLMRSESGTWLQNVAVQCQTQQKCDS